MPKLLQINITSNWGSTGKIAEAINLAAQRKGWECSTAYGRWANPSKFPTYKVGNKWDMYVHYFENRIFDREGLSSRRATKALIRHIEELKPDVISLHNIHDHYLNYELLFRYLNKTDIKVVWTFHDCWAFTGHCFHFVTKDCMRWKTGCHDCPLHHLYPNTVLDRSVKNYALKKELFSANENLAIVACSDWLGDFVKESFLGDKRIEVIHNGVDLQTFRPYGVSDDFKEFSFDSAQDKRQVSGGTELYNTGMVIEQGNVVALANAVMQMKDKPLSSADCRKRAEELFDKDKCFEKYVELYEDLLNSN